MASTVLVRTNYNMLPNHKHCLAQRTSWHWLVALWLSCRGFSEGDLDRCISPCSSEAGKLETAFQILVVTPGNSGL